MISNYFKLILKLLIISSVSLSLPTSYAEKYKRPMQIHKVKKMGLEIWTEQEPAWKTELMFNGRKPIFVAHTPFLSYPPSGMTWVNYAEVELTPDEFPRIARSTLETAAKGYSISKEAISTLKIIPASYGKLIGFEANFTGLLDKKQVDVKVFTGRISGKGPITMQVYAPKGKMQHIKEQIRRSWKHTQYLEK